MSNYHPSDRPPTPCTPHPSLAPYADQLDHWHKTEILLLQKVQALFRSRILPALSLPFLPSVPSVLSAPSGTQDPPLSQPPSAPPKPILPPHPLRFGPRPPPTASARHAPAPRRISSPRSSRLCVLCGHPLRSRCSFRSSRSRRSSPLLPLKPLLQYEQLLLKQVQLVLKAARPAEPRASPPQDDPHDYSKAIALMRKEYFADVDEYERSGLLKIPPLPDPCGAGILPASPAAT